MTSRAIPRPGALMLCAMLALGGCGGSVDGASAPVDSTPAPASTEVPDSALASASAFVSYLLSLVETTSESAEPLSVDKIGEAPSSETTEASALN